MDCAATRAVLATMVLALGCAPSPSPPLVAPAPPLPPQPVVVLITVGNLRADVVDLDSASGLTPHLSALAATASFAGPAVTGSSAMFPALASMLSGLPPSAHGVWSSQLDSVAPQIPWLAAELAAHGVHTEAWVGRPELVESDGWRRGFDRWRPLARLRPVRAALASPQAGASFVWIDLPGARPPWTQTQWAIPVDLRHDELPERLSADDLRALAHSPQPLPVETRRVLDALYRHAVAQADAAVGMILQAIAASPRAHETTVFVTSDGGFRLGEGNLYGAAQGLARVDIEIPLVVAMAPRLSGVPSVAPTVRPSLLRLAPSILELFGLTPPAAWEASLWRASTKGAISELPVSGGWRAASVVRQGFQLQRRERWGPPSANPLEPGQDDSASLELLLESRAWVQPIEEIVSWDGVEPGVREHEDLVREADTLTSPTPGRIADHRRLAGLGSRVILRSAPEPGAAGP